jgi:hypothetical protein
VAAPVGVPQPVEIGRGPLRRLRNDVYDCLTADADALSEVLNGLRYQVPVDGIAHLTLTAGRAAPTQPYRTLVSTPVCSATRWPPTRPADWWADFAVDVTTWARCRVLARPGPDHHPSRHSAGQPIVAREIRRPSGSVRACSPGSRSIGRAA